MRYGTHMNASCASCHTCECRTSDVRLIQHAAAPRNRHGIAGATSESCHIFESHVRMTIMSDVAHAHDAQLPHGTNTASLALLMNHAAYMNDILE